MLFGIVKKNGILQIDYTNQLREQGLERDEAILQANAVRLRPILMTTIMLVAAMIPIATGRGPGAASRASMAKVILGGQMLSLLLTLLVTPVAYSLWDDLIQWWQRRSFGWLHRLRWRKSPQPLEAATANSSNLGTVAVRESTLSLSGNPPSPPNAGADEGQGVSANGMAGAVDVPRPLNGTAGKSQADTQEVILGAQE
jgi:HAE1 family hydrophobic/amphiphilic exporter-1